MDGDQILTSNQNFRSESDPNSFGELQHTEALKKGKRFIREFVSQDIYIYRQQLIKNVANSLFCLEVEIDDIQNFDNNLFIYMTQRPSEVQVILEESIKQCYCEFHGVNLNDAPNFQLQIISQEDPRMLRELKSNNIGQLVTVSGIIISSTKHIIKAKRLCIQCKSCKDIDWLDLGNGMSGQSLPRLCKNSLKNGASQQEKCPMDPYVMIPERSSLIDQQILRIQENAEQIPTGEIPRHFSLCCDRYLVNQLVPGQRVVVTGVYSIQSRGDFNAKGKNTESASLKIPYIHVIGVQLQSKRYADASGPTTVSQHQSELFEQIARSPYIYKTIGNSIAPAIFGLEDIKLALACLLFGGSSKTLPDGMKLRGDINVLLVGDPSTAKSQLLKFIERVSDVAVYTSGKGSSAAGLTASITNSGQGGSSQFTLEAGALVIASGGVCCIDEFDKMRPEDRVVMHEAMEQQTISIAKAGITTRLNAKCSILAAANPIFGRYEESKSIQDQIELQTTILSRFDCIFIIKDKRTPETDRRMADHILNLHTGKFLDADEQGQMEEEKPSTEGGVLSMEQLKAFVKYAKSQPAPRLSNQAAQLVENLYVQDRQKSQSQGQNKQGGKSHIPITVRQLEAIIRLSESLAKMQLKKEVDEHHVREGHRLFLNSTMQAVSLGAKEFGLDLPQELRQMVQQIEDSIKRRIPIGSRTSYQGLKDELIGRFNNLRAIDFAINQMIQTEDLQQIEHRRMLIRKK